MFDPLGMLEIFRTGYAESVYARLNPLVKFILFTVFIILPLLSTNLLLQLFSMLAQIPLIMMSRSGRRVVRSLRASMFFILIIILLNYIATNSIIFSLSMVVRLLVMIIASAIFMNGSNPSEIGDVLSKLRVPTSITFSFIVALRFIPVLADDFMNIVASQASRGHEVERSGFIRRAKSLLPLLIPLIVIAIRRAQQLAEALESRCFGSGKRTSYISYGVSFSDFLALIYAIIVIIVGVSLATLPPSFPLLPFR
jgi:energy-coupling factor transport system permease protein